MSTSPNSVPNKQYLSFKKFLCHIKGPPFDLFKILAFLIKLITLFFKSYMLQNINANRENG